jgi:hypothetical protein
MLREACPRVNHFLNKLMKPNSTRLGCPIREPMKRGWWNAAYWLDGSVIHQDGLALLCHTPLPLIGTALIDRWGSYGKWQDSLRHHQSSGMHSVAAGHGKKCGHFRRSRFLRINSYFLFHFLLPSPSPSQWVGSEDGIKYTATLI